MSITLDIGNKMRLAPASNATCMHSAKLRTCTTVPPKLMSPITANCDCTGLANAAEHKAMKLASVSACGGPLFCNSTTCIIAWFKRHPSKQAGLMFHSDRGSQYASKDFRDVLKGYGITSSMSRRGNCWDNACSETLFGSLKVERLYGQRFKTRRAAKDETIAWLLWYNRSRLHSTLAYISPVQFEENWLANQPKQARS